ncbi:polyprenyl synthetase family protein [Anaerocolumna sedimenticola]|nr:polyprenyl synthetase family protein [Anaerocolumna sedimenticola]
MLESCTFIMINDKTKVNDNIQLIKFDDALEMVKKESDTVLAKSPLIIRGYTKHLMASRGKYIRAMSVIICAEDKNGLIHPNAVKIAAAIEILHLATLVHDDVIDNADLRRGDVTLQKKYGKRTAVICGDYLLCTALNLAGSISDKQDYLDLDMPDYMGKVCLGELNQHINNSNLNLSVYQYLKIISGKTAALFEASFHAGAIFSDCDKSECRKYKQLGYLVGMIFQLTDDCIDFEDTTESAKKPVQSDYEQGVITLPLIQALKNIKGFSEKAASSGISRAEINEAVSKAGGLNFTHMVVKKYYNKALKIINDIEVSDNKKEKLMTLLNKASRVN